MITYAHVKALKRDARALVRTNPGLALPHVLDQLARREGYSDWGALVRAIETPMRKASAA